MAGQGLKGREIPQIKESQKEEWQIPINNNQLETTNLLHLAHFRLLVFEIEETLKWEVVTINKQ